MRQLLFTGLLFLSVLTAQGQTRLLAAQDSLAFDFRIEAAARRLADAQALPAFSPDFVLADLQPDTTPSRRFDNFNGDLSGRYLQSQALLPVTLRSPWYQDIAARALRLQQADGRFGPLLPYETSTINKQHMAQLWGNGRMLDALCTMYEQTSERQYLEAARRLANWLQKVCKTVAASDKMPWLKTQHAYGWICYTQVAQALAHYHAHQPSAALAQQIRTIYKSLPERGGQHSHGYLITVRAAVHLYAQTLNAADLQWARARFDSLLTSPDYLAQGSVKEYFGPKPPYGPHDEGCSHADFYQLSFALWQTTGQEKYMAAAERCLVNQLMPNQFATGEWGHLLFDDKWGYKPGARANKSWWCCTMHGLTALLETRKAGTYMQKDTLVIASPLIGEARHRADSGALTLLVTTPASRLKARLPAWASALEIWSEGQLLKRYETAGLHLLPALPANRNIELRYSLPLQSQVVAGVKPMQGRFEARQLFYGPFMLCVTAAHDVNYLLDPSTYNLGYAATLVQTRPWRWQMRYQHDGFAQQAQATLVPLAFINLGGEANGLSHPATRLTFYMALEMPTGMLESE